MFPETGAVSEDELANVTRQMNFFSMDYSFLPGRERLVTNETFTNDAFAFVGRFALGNAFVQRVEFRPRCRRDGISSSRLARFSVFQRPVDRLVVKFELATFGESLAAAGTNMRLVFVVYAANVSAQGIIAGKSTPAMRAHAVCILVVSLVFILDRKRLSADYTSIGRDSANNFSSFNRISFCSRVIPLDNLISSKRHQVQGVSMGVIWCSYNRFKVCL